MILLMPEKILLRKRINIDASTIEYFKALAVQKGIPYQVLINLYLTDCAENRKDLELSWN